MTEKKGYRLIRIYARIGDGQQLPKSHPRIHAIGSVDEGEVLWQASEKSNVEKQEKT